VSELLETFGAGRPLDSRTVQDIGDSFGAALMDLGMDERTLVLNPDPGFGYIPANQLKSQKYWGADTGSKLAMQAIDRLPPRTGSTVKGPRESLEAKPIDVHFGLLSPHPDGSGSVVAKLIFWDSTEEIGAQRDAFRSVLGLKTHASLHESDAHPMGRVRVIQAVATFTVDSFRGVRYPAVGKAVRSYLPDVVTLGAPAPIHFG